MTGTAERRARERQERRDAILEAASAVFVTKGASEATMDDVAEAAQVSKGTLYLYFKSKDDLFVAMTHRPLDAVLARFQALVHDPSLDGASLLRRLIDAHSEVVQAHADNFRLGIARMCGGFTPDPSSPSRAHYVSRVRDVRATYIGAIERGTADGSLRPNLDPGEIAQALWAAMFGATFIRMNATRFAASLPDEDRPDLDRLVPTVADLLLAALTPRGNADG